MTPSKAVTFGQAAAAAGWTVKYKITDDRHVVHATRGPEKFSFAWVKAPTGNFNFEKGRHVLAGVEEEWTNVAAARKRLSEPEQAVRVVDGQVVALPFDIEAADDTAVLTALAGQRVSWANSLDPERIEEGFCPRGGIHFKIEPSKRFDNAGERIVTFASVDGSGFRSFALSALRGVSKV